MPDHIQAASILGNPLNAFTVAFGYYKQITRIIHLPSEKAEIA